ncbi:MAG: hypothetical protein ACXWQ5_00990 [Ktedonobacterales bacterium]
MSPEELAAIARSIAGQTRELLEAYPDSYYSNNDAFEDATNNTADDYGLSDHDRIEVAEMAWKILGTDFFSRK